MGIVVTCYYAQSWLISDARCRFRNSTILNCLRGLLRNAIVGLYSGILELRYLGSGLLRDRCYRALILGGRRCIFPCYIIRNSLIDCAPHIILPMRLPLWIIWNSIPTAL